jgi:regulator of RNase E activity RraB
MRVRLIHSAPGRVGQVTDPNLSESTWQRAKRDAEGVYKSPSFWVVVTIVGLLAVGFSVLATAGESDTTNHVVVPILSGVIALAIVFLIVLMAQVAAAPVRQRNDLRRNWSHSEPVQQINVGLTLSDFRRRGDDLLKSFRHGFDSEDEEAMEQWTADAIQFLSLHCDTALARKFIDASQAETKFLDKLEARLTALGTIIDAAG